MVFLGLLLWVSSMGGQDVAVYVLGSCRNMTKTLKQELLSDNITYEL